MELEVRSFYSWAFRSFHCWSLFECRSLITQTFEGLLILLRAFISRWIPEPSHHALEGILPTTATTCFLSLPHRLALPHHLLGSLLWLLPHVTIPAPPLGHWFSIPTSLCTPTWLTTRSSPFSNHPEPGVPNHAHKRGPNCLYSLILANISLESRICRLYENLP